jgi:hypothetical protein
MGKPYMSVKLEDLTYQVVITVLYKMLVHQKRRVVARSRERKNAPGALRKKTEKNHPQRLRTENKEVQTSEYLLRVCASNSSLRFTVYHDAGFAVSLMVSWKSTSSSSATSPQHQRHRTWHAAFPQRHMPVMSQEKGFAHALIVFASFS